MRALSQEQYEVLRDVSRPGPDRDVDVRDPVVRVYESLVARGCMVKLDCDESYWIWDITPLGRLALLHCRPEMAFTGLP